MHSDPTRPATLLSEHTRTEREITLGTSYTEITKCKVTKVKTDKGETFMYLRVDGSGIDPIIDINHKNGREAARLIHAFYMEWGAEALPT